MIKKIFSSLLFIIITGVIALAGYSYWDYQKLYPNTDDAYVQAHVINIAPRVGGMVSHLYVSDHQEVKAGQPLFDIDPAMYTIALEKAQANLDETVQHVDAAESAVKTAESVLLERQAQLVNEEKHTHRIITLVRKKLYPIADGDQAISNLKVAKAAYAAAQNQLQEAKQKLGRLGGANASVRAAKAAVAEAKLNLQYTHIVAPGSGYVVNLEVRQGDEVSAYQEVFAIIENHHWWTTANFKETGVERIRAGQTATIKLDMYPNHIFHGVVTSISAGSGASFALLPPENATGNWVKVTQRFPVRIDIIHPSTKYPLRMGSSCEVTIDTQHGKKQSILGFDIHKII